MISRKWVFSLYIVLLFSGSCTTPASAKPPSIVKFLSGITSNTLSALFKWLWSLKPTNKIRLGMPNRSMMKFESGYSVETVFDGSKLGIEPYSVEVTQSGELLVLDSENSNIHKISTPLSRYSEAKLVAGSYEGYSGHVDDKPLEAKMNHPKGFTVDDTGNIYVADTRNMAIRKITYSGVVTIAGGRGNDVKFSNDFDVIYVSSICSILVVDRGNQAIREIKLHDDDCYFNHYDHNLHLVFSWVVVLSVAVFFGFMLALLQTRITAMFSSSVDPESPIKNVHPYAYDQKPINSVRPPLIPPEDNEHEKEADFFNSLGKTFTGLFSSSKNKPLISPQINYQQPPQYFNTWPVQENVIIPHEYSPPLLQTRDSKIRKTHKLTTKKPEKARQLKQGRYIYGGHNKRFDQQYHQMHYLSGPQTYFEENNETTNEVVFGAVQEDDRSMLIKTIDYSTPSYDMRMRSRYNYMGYPYDMY